MPATGIIDHIAENQQIIKKSRLIQAAIGYCGSYSVSFLSLSLFCHKEAAHGKKDRLCLPVYPAL